MGKTSIGGASKGGSSLPIPKLRLSNNDGAGNTFVELEKYLHGGNTTDKSLRLYKFPEIVAMDLTQDQIDKGVFVEMLIYRKGGGKNATNNESGYVIPASIIGGVNNLSSIYGNTFTRGGLQQFRDNSAGVSVPLQVDRPNHYKVNNINEVVKVWEYLKNRLSVVRVSYFDINGSISNEGCLCPSHTISKRSNTGQNKFGYAGRYTPFYAKFRYIMRDDSNNQFISGPTSAKLKMCQKEHPFNEDISSSAIYQRRCNVVNPNTTTSEAQCRLETRLP